MDCSRAVKNNGWRSEVMDAAVLSKSYSEKLSHDPIETSS